MSNSIASTGRDPAPPDKREASADSGAGRESVVLRTSSVESLSESLVQLVAKAGAGVVAVKAAAYRVVSGVSLQDNLIAVTNHTLRREERIPVQDSQGKEGTAAIVGRDGSLDIAVLRVDGFALAPLAACEPGALQAGMLAAVVGMTSDVGPSASLGMLGAVGPSRRTWRGGTLDQFLRLDVNLYPSQSGAAVVNAAGELIGLATPALSRHAAIAIPAVTLQRVAGQLLKDGRIRHGYLGIGTQPVAIQASVASKLADHHLPHSGLILLNVETDSPAERAGLQVGDILLSLNGVATTDLDELQSVLRGDAVGQTLEAILLRGGERQSVSVVVGERTRKAK